MRHDIFADRLRDDLWDAVVDGEEHRAVDVVHAAAADGVDEETLLLDVIARVQEKIGVEWAADRLTVAQEHAATAINERVVASLADRRRDARRAEVPRGG